MTRAVQQQPKVAYHLVLRIWESRGLRRDFSVNADGKDGAELAGKISKGFIIYSWF